MSPHGFGPPTGFVMGAGMPLMMRPPPMPPPGGAAAALADGAHPGMSPAAGASPGVGLAVSGAPPQDRQKGLQPGLPQGSRQGLPQDPRAARPQMFAGTMPPLQYSAGSFPMGFPAPPGMLPPSMLQQMAMSGMRAPQVMATQFVPAQPTAAADDIGGGWMADLKK